MKRLMVVLAVMIGLPMELRAEESIAARKVLGGRMSLLVPTGFAVLNDAAKRAKYPGANAPANVLSNPDGSTNIVFDHKQVEFKPEDVAKLEQPMRAQLAGAKINSAGMRKLNGTDFLVFDADTPAPDGTIRNIMAFASLDNCLLAVSYNCTVSRDKDCGELGKRIIDSIVVNPKVAAH